MTAGAPPVPPSQSSSWSPPQPSQPSASQPSGSQPSALVPSLLVPSLSVPLSASSSVPSFAAPPGGRTAARIGALAVVAILAGAAGAGFSRAFSVTNLLPELPVAAVLPVVLVGLARYRDRQVPLLLSVCGWSAAFVVWACYTVAAGSSAGSAGPAALRDRLSLVGAGLADGPGRLLDVTLPAPAEPGLLVVPLAATWLAAAVGAEVVTRTRAALAAALPAAVVLVAATAICVPAPGDNLVSAAVVAAGGAVLAAGRPPRGSPTGGVATVGVVTAVAQGVPTGADRRDSTAVRSQAGVALGAITRPATAAGGAHRKIRRAGGTVVATGLVLVVGLLAALRLPADDMPFDPRDRLAAASTNLTGINPLSALGGWLARPDEQLFTVTVASSRAGTGSGAGAASGAVPPVTAATAVTEPLRLRLAVLDSYDGSTWATTGRFVHAGRRLAGASTTDAASGGDVVQRVDVTALGGTLMPATDRPVELRPVQPGGGGGGLDDGGGVDADLDVDVDPDSGTLVAARPLESGDRYQVVSAPPRTLSAAELTGLQVAADPDDAPTRAVPEQLPPVVRQLANVAAGRGRTAFGRAALLEDYLSNNFAFDPTAPAGHSLAHVEHFLTETRRGGSEQFATTFALAGRLLGLPTRVAVGFVPGSLGGGLSDGEPDAPGGRSLPVAGRDALAWPEVHFAEVGWVPFFPTPTAAAGGAASVHGLGQGESAEQAAAVDAVVGEDRQRLASFGGPGDGFGEPPAGSGQPLSDSASAGWALTAVLVALTVAYVAAVALAPRLARRRRRSAPSARGQVVGAWQSVIDTLSVAGATVPPAASPAEVVALGSAVGGPVGAIALRPLADLASTALFAPDEVFDFEGGAGPSASAEAWRLADAFERAVRETVGIGRRAVWRLSPRRVLADLRGGAYTPDGPEPPINR